MILDLHPDVQIQKLAIGAEKCPLLVIDNLIADADRLVRRAVSKQYVPQGSWYPGIRANAPPSYLRFIETKLGALLFDFFQLKGSAFKFAMCHYSLITKSAHELGFLQRIPHIDSTEGNALATIHYLFKGNLGGTAFYRHRKTGFEYIDASRKDEYFALLEAEKGGPNTPGPEYITGDTPLFEQIAKQEGVFNRMLIYRRNSLHSGSLGENFAPDPNPLTGRLSINSFIDVIP